MLSFVAFFIPASNIICFYNSVLLTFPLVCTIVQRLGPIPRPSLCLSPSHGGGNSPPKTSVSNNSRNRSHRVQKSRAISVLLICAALTMLRWKYVGPIHPSRRSIQVLLYQIITADLLHFCHSMSKEFSQKFSWILKITELCIGNFLDCG